MRTRRSGFTIIEMLFVVLLGSVVLGISTRAYGRAARQRAVTNARDAMILMGTRARSEAVRSGRLIYLKVDASGGVVEVTTSSDSVMATLEADDYGAGIVGDDAAICYTGRGYALPGCSVQDEQTIAFVRGSDTSRVVLFPLGQIRRSP